MGNVSSVAKDPKRLLTTCSATEAVSIEERWHNRLGNSMTMDDVSEIDKDSERLLHAL